MPNMKKAFEDAKREVEQDKIEEAKERFKEKLILLDRAEKLVKNLQRELEDLEAELSQN